MDRLWVTNALTSSTDPNPLDFTCGPFEGHYVYRKFQQLILHRHLEHGYQHLQQGKYKIVHDAILEACIRTCGMVDVYLAICIGSDGNKYCINTA